jgi:predicted PurR-regulated permease PerM
MSNQNNLVRTVINLSLAVIFILGIYFLLEPFFLSIISGAIIALITRPLYVRLLNVIKIRGLTAVLTMLIFILIFLIPFGIIFKLLINEVAGLSTSVTSPGLTSHFLGRVSTYLALHFWMHISIDPHQYFSQILQLILDRSGGLIGGFFGFIIGTIITILMAFYSMINHDRIRDLIKHYSPLPKSDTELIWQRAKMVIEATVTGNLILVGLQAIASMIGMSIFGVNAPVLIGSAYGLFSLVPSVGSSIIWVPVVLLQALTGHLFSALGVMLWSLIQVLLFDHLLGPQLVESRAKLHPFLVLLGVLGGVSQFGFMGIILGPTIIAIGIVGLEIIHRSWETPSNALL